MPIRLIVAFTSLPKQKLYGLGEFIARHKPVVYGEFGNIHEVPAPTSVENLLKSARSRAEYTTQQRQPAILQRMKYMLSNRRLFIQKLAALLAGTLLLIPLLYLEVTLPALLYVGVLLIIHVFFLYLYFTRTPWRQLTTHKAAFGGRVVAVVFFIYLLSIIKFEGDRYTIMRNILAALVVHAGILLVLMLIPRPPSDSKPSPAP